MVAGPNGSGKTALTRTIAGHEWAADAEYINPDDIAQQEFGDWNSPDAVRKAAVLATQRREDHLRALRSFVFETVF